MIKVIGFHDPDEKYGYLSNWYLSKFHVEDIEYSSMEQYMMYQKAIISGDTVIASDILSTVDPSKIKSLGRQVKGYNDKLWSGMRQIIVYNGLIEKFKQNDRLRNMLLDTGNAILAECAVNDRVWGIGLSIKDNRRFNMNEWNGQNLLGFSLMLVRENLR